MVIIQLNGGLGNQMFEYALYSSFLKKGIHSKLDASGYNKEPAHNGYELERIFHINGDYCSPVESAVVKASGKLLHLLFGKPYKETDQTQWTYQSGIANRRQAYLKGYWQTATYFEDVANELRQQFIFPAIADEKNAGIMDRIKHTNSVSLHIRRGDYLLDGRVCTLTLDYYQQAIALIRTKVTDPVFFIFSDDIQWAETHIKEAGAQFIGWNKGNNSYIDMQLMSACKHNIIANSSFSWWGAWLNNHPAKITIAPEKWIPNINNTRALIPKHWIQLPVSF